MKKRFFWIGAAAFAAMVYAATPFVSGLLGYDDPRGSIFYPAGYHDLLHSIGRVAMGKPRNKCPMTERPLFYGMAGKPLTFNKPEESTIPSAPRGGAEKEAKEEQ